MAVPPDTHDNREGESDVVSVSFEVNEVELVNAGRLHALATVTITVEGVELRLQGVRVMRLPTGMLAVEAPRFRRPAGEWVPAVQLPAELKDAIAKEILDMVEARAKQPALKPI